MSWRDLWNSADTVRALSLAPPDPRAVTPLEEAARCFEELAEVAGDLVWVVGRDGRILFGNRRWHAVTGIEPSEDFARVFPAFLHSDDRERWSDTWQHALRTDTPYALERRVRFSPEGEYVDQLERGLPVRGPEGNVIEWLLIATARKEEEQLIEGLRRALFRKDEALITVAHEMRSPLAPIASAVRLLEDHGGDPHFVADVRGVLARQVTQLIRLVDDLLDLGKMERRQLGMHKERVDLRTVLAAAVETTQPMFASREQELLLVSLTSPAEVQGDAGRLTQLVVNLLVNAAKFTDRGGRIWLSLEKASAALLIKVRDTGMGIRADMLPRIFDAYVQADRGGSGAASGLGLGLALAQQIARLHEGSLMAHSEGVGKGSEFVLQLPAASSH